MTTHKDALRKALEDIVSGEYRKVKKNEQCKHGLYGYEACENCIDEFAAEALAAQPEQQPDLNSVPHLIFFDDADRKPELYLDRAAALYRYEQISTSWNAHLFVKIDSNSRDCDQPNALLAASPIETAAKEGWISVSNGLPEKGLYIVNSTWGVRPAFKHDPAWADCFQDALTHSDEGMGHPDEKGPFRVIQYMRLPAAPQPPQENKE